MPILITQVNLFFSLCLPRAAPEQMRTPTQMQVYVRRWSPSKYTIGPFQEVILDSANPEELKKKVGDH